MKLISPKGVPISVADEKGEVLKAQGYREVVAEKAATPGTPAVRKRTARKTQTTDD
jgi:hypothetical protein